MHNYIPLHQIATELLVYVYQVIGNKCQPWQEINNSDYTHKHHKMGHILLWYMLVKMAQSTDRCIVHDDTAVFFSRLTL